MQLQDERKPGFLIAHFSVTGDHSFKGRWTRAADSSSPSGVCRELSVEGRSLCGPSRGRPWQLLGE